MKAEDFLYGPWPDDITIRSFIDAMENMPEIRDVMAGYPASRLRVVWVDDGVDLEETLTIGEVRWEIKNRGHNVRFIIESSGGGTLLEHTSGDE